MPALADMAFDRFEAQHSTPAAELELGFSLMVTFLVHRQGLLLASQFVSLNSEQARNYYIYEIIRSFARLSEASSRFTVVALELPTASASGQTAQDNMEDGADAECFAEEEEDLVEVSPSLATASDIASSQTLFTGPMSEFFMTTEQFVKGQVGKGDESVAILERLLASLTTKLLQREHISVFQVARSSGSLGPPRASQSCLSKRRLLQPQRLTGCRFALAACMLCGRGHLLLICQLCV